MCTVDIYPELRTRWVLSDKSSRLDSPKWSILLRSEPLGQPAVLKGSRVPWDRALGRSRGGLTIKIPLLFDKT